MPDRFSRIVRGIRLPNFVPSLVLSLSVAVVLLFVFLAWTWHYAIIPAEKGLYSPFESSLSFIRFLGLITVTNLLVAFSSLGRRSVWIYIPLAVTLALLLLTVFYFYTLLNAV